MGRHRYLLGDRAPEVARPYSDRQTKEYAEERGKTTQINALSRLVKQAHTQRHQGQHSMKKRAELGSWGCCPCDQPAFRPARYKLFYLQGYWQPSAHE